MKKFHLVLLLFLGAAALSGFKLDNAIIPPDEIIGGGPPKDGIPALLEPRFVAPDEADYLKPNDSVIGVVIGDEARAYPLKILTWHEAVMDTVGGEPIAATY